LRDGEPVSEIVGERLGTTLGTIALTGLFSLVIAAILLSLGVLVSRITPRPGWLAKLRSVLRLIFVSGGAAVPVFTFSAIFFISPIIGWDLTTTEGSAAVIVWSVFMASLLPAWLLVQAGHGEIANLPEEIPAGTAVRHLAVRLVIRLLRLTGIIIVATMATTLLRPAGLGTVLTSSFYTRDFPVIFGIVWIFVIIVVVVKLAADLIEIVYNRSGASVSANTIDEESSLQFALPKWWVIVSLALAGITVLVAIFGPMLAPYGMNEISIHERLAGPSAAHLLGTDNLGRDILSRLLYGTRLDVFGGLTCAGVMAVLTTGCAALAGYLKNRKDRLGIILKDVVTLPGKVITAFPWLALLLLITSMTSMTTSPDSDSNTMLVVLAVSLVLLPRGAAMIREAYQSISGEGDWLKNLLKAVPVMFIFAVGGTIFYLTAATYLGMGIYPPLPEMGGMLAGTGRQYMFQAPWMAQWPVLWLTLLLLIWVMAGDALLERLGFRSKAVWAKAFE
jgi:peptide/nickel transport system permease protein